MKTGLTASARVAGDGSVCIRPRRGQRPVGRGRQPATPAAREGRARRSRARRSSARSRPLASRNTPGESCRSEPRLVLRPPRTGAGAADDDAVRRDDLLFSRRGLACPEPPRSCLAGDRGDLRCRSGRSGARAVSITLVPSPGLDAVGGHLRLAQVDAVGRGRPRSGRPPHRCPPW